MTRELDWKIHELMGNDLTGFVWGTHGYSAVKVTDTGVTWVDIPHYSTTWEGAGLVMEWLNKECIDHEISSAYENGYAAVVDTYTGYDCSAPLALAKAFISAMEGLIIELSSSVGVGLFIRSALEKAQSIKNGKDGEQG